MPKQEDRIMAQLICSFNKVSDSLGTDLDSVMADTAIEIIAMKDVQGLIDKTFFERGILLLTDSEGEMADNIKACLFWWVFNEEKMMTAIIKLTQNICK